jgi:hypothetical protein
MIIFRYEHKREACQDEQFKLGGPSLTGHGSVTFCASTKNMPNFGACGNPPRIAMMKHERCAVTAEQFKSWISPTCTYNCVCTDTDLYCYCPSVPSYEINHSDDWHIVSYWIEDAMEGVDWRFDNNQVIFNPAFATLIGPVVLWEVEQFVNA